MGKFIDHNTQKLTNAKTNFEKDLYKLLNNAFLGKTMEKVRERTSIEIIPHTGIDQIIKKQSTFSFEGMSQQYNDFSLYNYGKEKITIDKPIYSGFRVLELSKLLMYELFYHKLQPFYNGKVELHYMDTDCFFINKN